MVNRKRRIVNESLESNFRNPYGAYGVEVHRDLSEARVSKGSLCFPAVPNGRASDTPGNVESLPNQVRFALPHDYYFTAELLSN
jgi:hypothetical protein